MQRHPTVDGAHAQDHTYPTLLPRSEAHVQPWWLEHTPAPRCRSSSQHGINTKLCVALPSSWELGELFPKWYTRVIWHMASSQPSIKAAREPIYDSSCYGVVALFHLKLWLLCEALRNCVGKIHFRLEIKNILYILFT